LQGAVGFCGGNGKETKMTTFFQPFQSFSKFPCKRAKRGENDKKFNFGCSHQLTHTHEKEGATTIRIKTQGYQSHTQLFSYESPCDTYITEK